MQKFFSIRNWKTFQHYTKRNPPWIRLYQNILQKQEYQALPEAARSHLFGLFLLAAREDNRIPEDGKWLRHALSARSPIDLDLLRSLGWIEDCQHEASAMLAPRKQDATPDSEVQNTEAEVQSVLAKQFPERDPEKDYKIVLKLPTCCFENGSPFFFEIDEYDVAEWKHKLPGLEIVPNLKRAKRYLETHPETVRGFDDEMDSYLFCDRWLQREYQGAKGKRATSTGVPV